MLHNRNYDHLYGKCKVYGVLYLFFNQLILGRRARMHGTVFAVLALFVESVLNQCFV
jgi:hypothetical protein